MSKASTVLWLRKTGPKFGLGNFDKLAAVRIRFLTAAFFSAPDASSDGDPVLAAR
jgi:hypothetical protein